MEDEYWKHVWQCSHALAQFIASNFYLFAETTVLEMGAGCAGIPGLIASKCSAKCVILTDHPSHKQALKILRKNTRRNKSRHCELITKGFDWIRPNIKALLRDTDKLDYIIASDVLYDPVVFEPVILTLSKLLKRDPKCTCIFTYEERDSNWSIEDYVLLNGLSCRRINVVETDNHTIHLGLIFTANEAMKAAKKYLGIEGGATQSKMVVIDEDGKIYGEWKHDGLNSSLTGARHIGDKLAMWIRTVKKEADIVGPLASVGLGLSGAENEERNAEVVSYLKSMHGDLALEFFLSSDALVSVEACFPNGGVIVVAGTGSSCRLIKSDGSKYGVGGWGHQIGDGGSAFWIARRIIQLVFDEEDGLYKSPYSIVKVKQLLLEFFKLSDKSDILDHLYADFEKSKIASFTSCVVKEADDDPLVCHVFNEAGEILGQHLQAISKNFDQDMLDNVPVLLVGSLWQSFDMLKDGFLKGLRKNNTQIKRVTLHKLLQTSAVGAALLAAKKLGKSIPHELQLEAIATLDL